MFFSFPLLLDTHNWHQHADDVHTFVCYLFFNSLHSYALPRSAGHNLQAREIGVRSSAQDIFHLGQNAYCPSLPHPGGCCLALATQIVCKGYNAVISPSASIGAVPSSLSQIVYTHTHCPISLFHSRARLDYTYKSVNFLFSPCEVILLVLGGFWGNRLS